MKKLILTAIVILLLLSCSNKPDYVDQAFYYWKSDEWGLGYGEGKILDTLDVKKLYVKFFEVNHSDVNGNIPISKTSLRYVTGYDNYFDSINVIPTVYIKNEVVLKSTQEELDTLASNINYLIDLYYKDMKCGQPLKEFQMDCDWTPNSKNNYFYFLKSLKKVSGKTISCTLRLYPYKYPDIMGIPPVDKVSLMCYNLMDPLKNEDKNTILDVNELSLYLDKKRDYPVHLDIALPVYSWGQWYSGNNFRGVFYVDSESIKEILQPIKPLWYEVTADKYLQGNYLRAGDRVKYEQVRKEDINKAIAIIKERVVLKDTVTISLFHLDKEQLNRFTYEALFHFYTAFSE
ncbi:hypothetical protein [Flavobacterium sp. C4GT6]|uniref:hypothetical protein n=1 Tax=Flavobacterium sp. C4GT6 TaxID=3103818 RepID=UPI002ED3A907